MDPTHATGRGPAEFLFQGWGTGNENDEFFLVSFPSGRRGWLFPGAGKNPGYPPNHVHATTQTLSIIPIFCDVMRCIFGFTALRIKNFRLVPCSYRGVYYRWLFDFRMFTSLRLCCLFLVVAGWFGLLAC